MSLLIFKSIDMFLRLDNVFFFSFEGTDEKSLRILTIQPTHDYHLNKGQEYNRYDSGVMVHQLENIDSRLNRNIIFRETCILEKYIVFWKWFKTTFQTNTVHTCKTHGIPRRKDITQIKRTNISLRLKIFIRFTLN